MAYTYTPSNVSGYGPDRMRFELGDTMVEGGVETCALCDEEYIAVLSDLSPSPSTRQWKKHKLRCIEAIMRKFAYEPDQKIGPLDIKFGDRAKLWKQMYDDLKADLGTTAASASAIAILAQNPNTSAITPPYFYNGMMSHEEAEGTDI